MIGAKSSLYLQVTPLAHVWPGMNLAQQITMSFAGLVTQPETLQRLCSCGLPLNCPPIKHPLGSVRYASSQQSLSSYGNNAKEFRLASHPDATCKPEKLNIT